MAEYQISGVRTEPSWSATHEHISHVRVEDGTIFVRQTVVDDLRSPMNALAGILNLLENENLKPEEFRRLTGELRIQFNHTKALINNLLDWTLLQMDKLDIAALTQAAQQK